MNDQTRALARSLFVSGLSRNEIARQLDLDPATITRWAKAAGLEFDRSATEAAVKAHTIDLAAARIRLAEKMLSASETMLDQIDDEYLVYNFGGKDNTYEEHTLTSAPVEVKRSIVVTAGITFDKLTRIVEKDNGGLEQAVGVLDQIADGFKAAAEKYRSETPSEPE
ncbi:MULTISPECIES: hypothetical protein [Cryobacterium]|uniref:Terminase ATPase subunit N-terminal domain-containing protein n=1 Tax=Cryobacterium breve TaxID=1259258 RepID=A0ABY2J813_9MICO|nr:MULTISPECIES: hypothetical protein [Cryobacterium]TFC92053.1 hypothetical protein E3T20_12120 [Cryobacterium sp. TmT3-12]TFC99808.1 hypothetical protein E3O65_05385 [Cryobacterium breve]